MSLGNSLLGPFGQYEPTGAFSFEFWKRDKNTKQKSTKLTEVFFLLPPEEYTMTEGYKLTVTKTLGGAWVDDSGNDLKNIKLSGSLYSYYFGVPSEAGSDYGSQLMAEGKNTLKEATKSIPVLPPGLSGISGIDEFFKLRYIVNRFRDNDGSFSFPASQERSLLQLFPELSALVNFDKSTGARKSTWDNFVCIYHDYDDSNHFEVIFNEFSATRTKDDPFTVNYSIDMTALSESKGDLKTFGPLGNGIKETVNNVMGDIRKQWRSVLGQAATLATIPLDFAESWNNLLSFGDQLSDDLDEFVTGVKGDYEPTVATGDSMKTKIGVAIDKFLSVTLSASKEDLEDEIVELDEDTLEVYSSMIDMLIEVTRLAGMNKYSDTSEKIKIFDGEEASISDSDFEIDAVETDDNRLTERAYGIYTIKYDDTLFKIAQAIYGDFRNASLIGQINDLQNKDFEDDALLGTTIKIPVPDQTQITGIDSNLVYSKIVNQTLAPERQKRVLGADLNLTFTRDFKVDGTGDLALVYGDKCYDANIVDRLSFLQGSLWELHPEWGMITGIGEVPKEFLILKIIDHIESQAYLDPRTDYAYVKRDKLSLEADTLKIDLVTKPLSGEENVIDVGTILAGQLL